MILLIKGICLVILIASAQISGFHAFILTGSKKSSNDCNNNDTILTLSSNNNMNMDSEITALARIDRDFQLTTRSSKRPTGGKAGWTKLILDSDDDGGGDSLTENQQKDFVYLFEPQGTPSSLLLFLGGAGLGQYPHIAYNEFLSRISQRINAAIITAPYPLGLDHFELSKKSGEKLRRAVIQCEENGYSSLLPKFYLGHSLGSKLLTISLSATGIPQDISGIGFLNYNNFGFTDTIKMVKSFTNSMGGTKKSNNPIYSQIFDFAEQAVNMSGLDFSPNPSTTNKIISMKYDETFQQKTRLFIFDNDDLDCSQGFIDACNGNKLSISKIPGNHLSCVYIKIGVDDLEIPPEAKMFTDEITGGFQNASFGNEADLNAAITEVCNWLLGKKPQMILGSDSFDNESR